MSELGDRLEKFLLSRAQSGKIQPLTADASTREYFRVEWNGASAIACVYPQSFDPSNNAYLDVTRLFLSRGVPVAEILGVDGSLGVIVQEDLGDLILRDVLMTADSNASSRLLDEAISLIAKIQTITDAAFETGSVASKLKFDADKLSWELDFFKNHYFETYRKRPLCAREAERIGGDFLELSRELEARAAVLCHRDFHAANLMIDTAGRMRIIDHQDARIGSATYDLVSLLLDRITEMPSAEWLAQKRRFLLDKRIQAGLADLDESEFAREFWLQTIQRCLKAAGTFSFQSVNRGKTYFVPFIKPMLRISLRAAESLGRFPAIQEILRREIGA